MELLDIKGHIGNYTKLHEIKQKSRNYRKPAGNDCNFMRKFRNQREYGKLSGTTQDIRTMTNTKTTTRTTTQTTMTIAPALTTTMTTPTLTTVTITNYY